MSIWIGLAALAAIGVIVVAAALFSTFFVQTTINRIPADRLSARCRIAHITDLHGRTRFANGSVAELVNRALPDIVCITGDLATSRKQLPRVLAELRRITCPCIVFVPGNYEREEAVSYRKRLWTAAEYADTVRRLELSGAKVLANARLTAKGPYGRVTLLGFDNSLYGNETFEHASAQEDDKGFRVAMAHSPSIASELEARSVPFDLLLAGHTHGGQIRLFRRTFGSYGHFHVGLKMLGGSRLIFINRGLGTVKLPFRLNCFPEIALFDLEPLR